MIPHGITRLVSWWFNSSQQSVPTCEVSFNTLPHEVALKILSYCDFEPKEFKECSTVCKKWKALIDPLFASRQLTGAEQARRAINSAVSYFWFKREWRELNLKQNQTLVPPFQTRLLMPSIPPFFPLESLILKEKGTRWVVKTEEDLLDAITTIARHENPDQRIAIHFYSLNDRDVKIKIFFEKAVLFNPLEIKVYKEDQNQELNQEDQSEELNQLLAQHSNTGTIEKMAKARIPAFFDGFNDAIRTYVIRGEEEATYSQNPDHIPPPFSCFSLNKPLKGHAYLLFMRIAPELQKKIQVRVAREIEEIQAGGIREILHSAVGVSLLELDSILSRLG